jgi:hypothetical protein
MTRNLSEGSMVVGGGDGRVVLSHLAYEHVGETKRRAPVNPGPAISEKYEFWLPTRSKCSNSELVRTRERE